MSSSAGIPTGAQLNERRDPHRRTDTLMRPRELSCRSAPRRARFPADTTARVHRSAWNTHFWTLFSTARNSVHWVTRSVTTRVKACSPGAMTAVVAHQIGAHLAGRGIRPFGEGADRDLMHQAGSGLGVGAPARRCSLRFSARGSRSMVAALMRCNLPHIPPNSSQRCLRARYTSWS